jgi:parallel beta-helix repeat protein
VVKHVGIVLALMMIVLIAPTGRTGQAPTEALEPRGAILIQGNEDFTAANGVRSGSGTSDDPYVIEGWLIDAPGDDMGIRLVGTDAYVIIRRCEVRSTRFAGVLLEDTSHVTIEDCRASGSERGFQISESRDVKLARNVAEYNRKGGFFVFGSQDVEFVENEAWYNWEQTTDATGSWGIYADEASKTRGRNNLSSGHARDIIILKTAGTRDDRFDLFSSPEPALETSCTQIFNEFFLFIGRLEGTEPLSEPYCALLLSILRSLPGHLRGQIAQFILMPESDEAAGMYTGVGTVRLFANLKHLKAFTETTYHEIGHVLQDRLFTGGERERWSRLHERSGGDPDNYPIQDADAATRASAGILSYGMVNQFEDFASTFEAYTRDSLAMARRAQRIETLMGKTILREKVAFLISLFRGLPYVYRKPLDWDTESEEANVRIQRAQISRLENGLPVVTDDLVWEEF